jgi:hypothetical protein
MSFPSPKPKGSSAFSRYALAANDLKVYAKHHQSTLSNKTTCDDPVAVPHLLVAFYDPRPDAERRLGGSEV